MKPCRPARAEAAELVEEIRLALGHMQTTGYGAMHGDLLERAAKALSADLIYVPGLLRCKKCGFELHKRTLHMQSGHVGANNAPDNCPNDGSPMWRVSEREYRVELFANMLKIRNSTLDVAAKICRDLVEKMNKRGRLQARAILHDCANQIEARKTEEGATS